jgi:hypothetical protein
MQTVQLHCVLSIALGYGLWFDHASAVSVRGFGHASPRRLAEHPP